MNIIIGNEKEEIFKKILSGTKNNNNEIKNYEKYIKLNYHENFIFNLFLSHLLERDILIIGNSGFYINYYYY
jgi:hypothetical protein